MTKHSEEGHPKGVIRDRAAAGEAWTVGESSRVILFPTEPSTIGREKIDRAVERVLARRK